MTRRHLLLALGIGLAVLVAVAAISAVWWPAEPAPYIDQAHFDRIKVGMRQDEIEAILGCPPGDYRGGKLVAWRDAGPSQGEPAAFWSDENGEIFVAFSDDGKATGYPAFSPYPSHSLFHWLVDAVRRLLP